MLKKKKCYIYTHVSTAIQVDGYSLDAQKDKLRKSFVGKHYGKTDEGSFIKVGKFDERDRGVYHNDLEESLIVNASKVIDLIYQMYLKAKNGYGYEVS